MRFQTGVGSRCTALFCMALTTLLVAVPAIAGDGVDEKGSSGVLLSAGESGYPDIPDRNAREANFLFPSNQETRFLTFHFGQRTMGGDDFAGDTFYTSDTELFMIPDMEDAQFYGVSLDFRKGYLGGGIGYTRASHDWNWAGLSADPAQATSHFVDFNFRVHALPEVMFQPFGMLGFSLNGIRVEDGKYRAQTDDFSNLSMYGIGLNWGAGVDFYPSRQLKISGGARWHADHYSTISGQDLDEGLTLFGVNYFISVGMNLGL